MYAGQVGCGVLALIACIVLNVVGFVILAAAGNMSPSDVRNMGDGAAVIPILAFAAFGVASLIWLVSFIMGIVAAGKR